MRALPVTLQVLEDGRRLARVSPPAACLRAAVPAWTEREPLEALAPSLAGALSADAQALWLEVEPESVPAYLEALALVAPSRSLLVPAPVAPSPAHHAALAARFPGVRVALRMATSVGLRRVRALREKKGVLRELSSVRVVVPTPGTRGLGAAARFKPDFDALLGAVAELLSALSLLGVEAPGLAVQSEPGERYFDALVLATPEGVLPRVELRVEENHERRSDVERAELRGPGGALLWQRAGDAERVTVRFRGSYAEERMVSAPMLEAALGPCEASAPWTLEGHAPHAAVAAELVEQFLYGNNEALRRERGRRLAERYAGPGSYFHGFAVSAQAGFEVAFVASLEQSQRFQRPLERPTRVLLLRAPVLDERARGALFPSLALAQLAGTVASVGATVQCVDLALSYQRRLQRGEAPEEMVSALLGELRSTLAWSSYDLLGVAIEEEASVEFTLALLRGGLREVAAHVVLGGRGAGGSDYALAGSKLVDSVLAGEGELGLLRLLEHLTRGASEDTVPGLWKTSWALHRRVPPVLPDFDFHPLPLFEGIDLGAYNSGKPDIPAPFLPYLFALGCPYKCAFCANDSAQKGRYRSPERTARELSHLVRNHGVRAFYFLNNLINNDPREFARFLDEMERLKLDLAWADCARPYGIDAAQMARLKSVGCVELTFGIDTGSQRLSNLMRKGYKIEKAVETVLRTRDAGIHPVVNLLVGLPHETEEDFEQTVRFVERMLPVVRAFSISAYEYTSGSPVYDTPVKFGLRRKGETFDERGGVDYRTHRLVRRQRFEYLTGLTEGRLRGIHMPGFRGYDPREPAAPAPSRSVRLPVVS